MLDDWIQHPEIIPSWDATRRSLLLLFSLFGFRNLWFGNLRWLLGLVVYPWQKFISTHRRILIRSSYHELHVTLALGPLWWLPQSRLIREWSNDAHAVLKKFSLSYCTTKERSMTTALQYTQLHSSKGKFSPQSSSVSSVEEFAFDESVRWYKKRVISAFACVLHPYSICFWMWECLCWVQVVKNVQPVQPVQEGVGGWIANQDFSMSTSCSGSNDWGIWHPRQHYRCSSGKPN